MITVLKSKLHRGVITESDLNYEGSITVDPELLQRAGIHEYEQVDVLDINNGQRFTTYAIKGKAGSRQICVNGAAARLVQKGDLVIICAYKMIAEEKIGEHKPVIVLLDGANEIKAV